MLLRRLLPVLLPVLLLAALLGHATGHWQSPMLASLEHQAFDVRLRLFAPAEADRRIVLVDIDERSLAALGRWPWKRSLLADLLEQMFNTQGALLVGVDLILAEPDDSSGLASLEALARGALKDDAHFARQLQALRPSLDHDARLARVLQTHAVVLGFHGSDGAGAVASGLLPPPLMEAATFGPQAADLPHWRGYGANLPPLQEAAAGAGFLNVQDDADGVSRRAPLLGVIEGRVYASLPLVLMQTLSSATAVAPALAGTGGAGAAPPLVGLSLQTPRGRLHLPTDTRGAVLVPYRSAQAGYQHFSAVDVLQGRLPADALRGRIVLLGASAPGLLDHHTTPFGQGQPGLDVHASVLSGLLDGQLPSTPAYSPALETGQLLAIALILLLLLPRLGLIQGLLLGGLLGALVLTVNFSAWSQLRQAWPLASAMLLLPALLGLHLLFAYFGEQRAVRRLSALFGRYVPPERVRLMSRHPERYSMASRSMELSVLFADVRGFTGIAERLPPDELAALMHDFFSSMTGLVQAHGGTLDKYMGDALMAFWGAPVETPGHARQAVQAALAMQAALQGLNERFAARGWPCLSISIGINSGTMVVGDLGSRQRRAYTVLGDNVNLAARMQQLCSERGLDVLISEATRERIGPELRCLDLGLVKLRGRAAAARIFQVRPDHPGGIPEHRPGVS